MILYFKQWHHDIVTGNNDVSLDIIVQIVKVVPIHVLQVTGITPFFYKDIDYTTWKLRFIMWWICCVLNIYFFCF